MDTFYNGSAGTFNVDASHRRVADLTARNRQFYDGLWAGARLVTAERFSTWNLVAALLPAAAARLEIGPGLRPRLPLAGTVFLDLSRVALGHLAAAGARGACGTVTALPFPDASFDLVCALDVVEHVADDAAAWAELARVARPGAVLLLSVPLHATAWTAFDTVVGHGRRYEPAALWAAIAAHGFAVEQSAPFGMQPRSNRLTALGMWFLAHAPGLAMRWYNRVFPLVLRRQPPLTLAAGVPATEGVAEILLVCRKTAP
jgi:SAM-dependent methyltransferase